MKKSLLFCIAIPVGLIANAQQSVVFTETQQQGFGQHISTSEVSPQQFEAMRKNRLNSTSLYMNKGTLTSHRVYNYIDLLATQTPTIDTRPASPYLWEPKRPALAAYSSGYDTVNFGGFGQTLHPWYKKWKSQFGFPNMPNIDDDASYTIDTIRVYGGYLRNIAKTGVVDTLRISLAYGDGEPNSTIPYFTSDGTVANTIATAYNVPTLRYVRPRYDTAKAGFGPGPSGSAVKYFDYLMKDAGLEMDAAGNGFANFVTNFKVPAGNIAGVSVSFYSGDPAFSAYDTILLTNGATSVEAKFNTFRPRFYEQNLMDRVSYYPDSNYNNGLIKFSAADDSSLYNFNYYPTYFLVPEGTIEFPLIDFAISSNEFTASGIKNGSSAITYSAAIPNPATNEVAIPVVLNTNSDVAVVVLNAIGQTVAQQQIKSLSANVKQEVRFNTTDWPTGIYTYTVFAGGEKVSNRFTVIH